MNSLALMKATPRLSRNMSSQTTTQLFFNTQQLLGNLLERTKLGKINSLGQWSPFSINLKNSFAFTPLFWDSSTNWTLFSIIVPQDEVGSWYFAFSSSLLGICSDWRFPLLKHLRKKLWKFSKGKALKVSTPHWNLATS